MGEQLDIHTLARVELHSVLMELLHGYPEWWTARDTRQVAEALASGKGYCRICQHYQSRIGHAGECARAAAAGAPPQKLGRSQHDSCEHGELRLPHLEPISSLLSRAGDPATPEDHS